MTSLVWVELLRVRCANVELLNCILGQWWIQKILLRFTFFNMPNIISTVQQFNSSSVHQFISSSVHQFISSTIQQFNSSTQSYQQIYPRTTVGC